MHSFKMGKVRQRLGVSKNHNVHQFHHFECLKYVLDTNLQSNKKAGKGMERQDRTIFTTTLQISPFDT